MLVGIDLGTTFSLIAYVGANGTPTLCPGRTDAQRFLTPSVVHVGIRGALVGDLVEQLLDDEPGLSVCRFAKLAMGTDGVVHRDHQDFAYRAETVSSLVLKKLRQDAEAVTGETITGAVITIPAHFNDAQRQATIDAARLADLPLRGLVEEPVAAAAYFGHHAKSAERTIFTFDLGGGTLDATILQATPTGLYVLATVTSIARMVSPRTTTHRSIKPKYATCVTCMTQFWRRHRATTPERCLAANAADPSKARPPI